MSGGLVKGRVELDLSPGEGVRKAGVRKATRIGLSRAASPVKGAVVGHAERIARYGFLARAIRIRLRVYPADKFVAVIGPSTKYVRTKGKYTRGKKAGEKRVSRPSKYAHLVEGGTKRSRAKPWLKPAYQETAWAFLDRAAAEVRRELELELARQRAK